MSNKVGNTALVLLVGVALGAIAGILLAPDKGSKLFIVKGSAT